MVKQIAQKNIGHIGNRAPSLGAIVPTARVPAGVSFDMNLSTDVAVSHSSIRQDGHWIQIVVHALEVSVHLYQQEELISQTWSLGARCILAWELNQFAHAGFPTLGVP